MEGTSGSDTHQARGGTMLNASRPAPPVKGGVLQAHDGSLHPQTRMAPLTGAPKAREGSMQRLFRAQQTLPAARVTGEVLQDRELAAPRSEVGVGASPPRTLPRSLIFFSKVEC